MKHVLNLDELDFRTLLQFRDLLIRRSLDLKDDPHYQYQLTRAVDAIEQINRVVPESLRMLRF